MAEFKDTVLQKSMSENGYNCVPIFSKAEIGALEKLYEEYFSDVQVKSIYASHSRGVNTAELSIEISYKMNEILGAALERSFKNYRFFIGHFISKQANFDEEFQLHQDWNIVDESKNQSIQIWIPLGPSNPDNGGLFVMKHSHKFYQNYRSGSFGLPRISTDDIIKPYLSSFNMTLGEAIVYYNSTFHGSYPNHTPNDRLVVIISIVPTSPTLYYHLNREKNQTEVYQVETESFLKGLDVFEAGKQPDPAGLVATLPIPAVDNATINSINIVQQYKDYEKNNSGFNGFIGGVKKMLFGTV